MSILNSITKEEIKILLQECTDELDKIKRELGILLIKQDILRRKRRQWEEEREYLELLQSGVKFDEFIVKVPTENMKTLKKHYADAMGRYKEMFGDK